MKITDGNKVISVKMYTHTEAGNTPDWSEDFFNAGNLEYIPETDIYKVPDVDYCVEQAQDWKQSKGDFCDDQPNDGNMVEVIEYYYWLDTEYHIGDATKNAFALICGERDADGRKDRETERIVLCGEYENLKGYKDHVKAWYDEIADKVIEEVDANAVYELIDEFIKEQLGFLPDYEVN